MTIPPLPYIHTHDKMWLNLQVGSYTMQHYKWQQPRTSKSHQKKKKEETPSDGPQCSFLSVQCLISKSSIFMPAQARGIICTPVDLQPSVCLSDPLSAAQTSVACKITVRWWANATPELTPVWRRLVKCLTPWGAMTCFPFNSSISLTGAFFELAVLAVPINPLRIGRFRALFLLSQLLPLWHHSTPGQLLRLCGTH